MSLNTKKSLNVRNGEPLNRCSPTAKARLSARGKIGRDQYAEPVRGFQFETYGEQLAQNMPTKARNTRELGGQRPLPRPDGSGPMSRQK